MLLNALTLDILAELVVEEETWLFGPIELGSDFYGVFGSLGTGGLMTDEGVFTYLSDGTLTEANVVFHLVDEALNVIDTFDIIDPQLISNYFRSIISYENGILLFYYLDWGGIYVYNAKTQETSHIMAAGDFIFHRIILTPNNELAFVASTIKDEEHMHYGIIDLETGNINFSSETDLNIYDLFIDGENIVLRYSASHDGSEGGFIVVNVLTYESDILPLADDDGMNAKLISNGQLILARHTEWSISPLPRVRVYDRYAMTILFEHEMTVADLNLEAGEEIFYNEFVAVTENIYALVIGISTSDGLGFDLDSVRFHTTFIVIEELDK